MSMSTHVKGFIPDTDPTYQKHKKVLVACHEAGIEHLPTETAAYFGDNHPCLSLLEAKLEVKIPVKEVRENGSANYEVYLKDIPEGVEKIRFANTW